MSETDHSKLSVAGTLAETGRRLWDGVGSWLPVYTLLIAPLVISDAAGWIEPLGEYGPGLLLVFIAPLYNAAVILTLLSDAPLGLAELCRRAAGVYWRVLLVYFLRSLALIAGIWAAVVPGILAGAWFCLGEVVAIQEDVRSPFKALFRSRDLIRGRRTFSGPRLRGLKSWSLSGLGRSRTLQVILCLFPLVALGLGGRAAVIALAKSAEGAVAPWAYPVDMLLDLVEIGVSAQTVVIYQRLRGPLVTPENGS